MYDQECQKIIDDYGLVETDIHGNERAAFVGDLGADFGMASIRLSRYGSFLTVNISLGEIRHIGSNHTPLGEFGLLSASGHVRDEHSLGGHGLEGGDLLWFVWRVGAVASKCRTQVPKVGDKYVLVDDIVAHLLVYTDVVRRAFPADQDPTLGTWEKAYPGW